MGLLLKLIFILLILNNILNADEILEKEKIRLFELYNDPSFDDRHFYDSDSYPVEKINEIKLLAKKILKKDPDYEFYRNVILIYAFACNGLNYQYFFTDRSKYKDDVEELFDLDEFEEPLQWLILGHYFTWSKIWGNRSFGRIKIEDGLKYFKKIIKKYPKSKYVDDAYLGMGNYYMYNGWYGRRINLPETKQKEYIKKSIKIYENILKEHPNSNSALITKQFLARQYEGIDKKKAEKFINKCIAEYRKKGKTEAVVRLLDRKISMFYNDPTRQEEVIQILEEIYSKTRYRNMRNEAERLLIDKYQKTGKYDKLLKIYNRRLKEAKAKGDKKKIKNCKEWIKKIKKLKEKKNK